MRIRRNRRSDFVQKMCKEETCSQTFDNSVDMEGGLGQDDGMVTPLFGDVEVGRTRSLRHISFSAGYKYPPSVKELVTVDASFTPHVQQARWKNSIIVDQATTTKQTHSNHELEMVQLRGSWGGCGQRKCRKKSTSWKEAETSYLFGFLKPFVSEDVKFGTRKNYSHWTSHEVEKLLNGVDEHGVGNWALIKRTYFKTLPRTAEHLKDKWRGLCRACGLKVGSKQKVKAQPATREFLKGFTNKIREMARKHDA